MMSADIKDQPSTAFTWGIDITTWLISSTRYGRSKLRVTSAIKYFSVMTMKFVNDLWTLKTPIKIAPPMVRVNNVSNRRRFRRKVLRREIKVGRESHFTRLPILSSQPGEDFPEL